VTTSDASAGTLRRDRDQGWLGGVAAGIARRYGVDVSLVRLAFVVAAAAGGVGIAAYALGWLLIPAGDSSPGRVRIRTGRAAVEVALGTGLLLVAVLLTFRELGLWLSDAAVWPLVLIAAGGVLIWRQSMEEPAPARAERPPEQVTREESRRAAAAISRTGVGIALVVAAGLVFLQATGALGAARDVLLGIVAVVVVLGVIFAPWVVRLVRSLTQERAERIRSQERAEVAAHLHDSVLQTLAMVQRSGDPSEVAALARRQERELDQPHEAVVAATREAMTNAAKFGAGSPVDVYAESDGRRTQVFVRDRGPGFDTEAVPPDRRGVSESIVGRMERHGGRARVTSAPGSGTEVELILDHS
jgi:signal transduction histidine kinase